MKMTQLIIAVATRKSLSILNVLKSIDLIGAFESLVVAISNIIERPRVIIRRLLPKPEPIATPYAPSAAAYTTMAISGKVVATLRSVLPTNLAPYLKDRCSAP